MFEITTHIDIDAGIPETWKVFSSFSGYPEWNPFIRAIKGDVAIGKKIEVMLQQPGMKLMKMKPKVLVFEKKKELRWIGHLGIPGLFDGEHVFRLVKNDNGSTRFIQKEIFRGLLVPLFIKMLDTKTRKGFELMNCSLKEIVESQKGHNS